MTDDKRRRYSAPVVDGVGKSASRAMLRAVGFTDEDFRKPQIGIASTWSNLTPCNMHIHELAEASSAGADSAGGKSLIFNTITVSDGIANGTLGMKYSLVSREVIADSIETVAGCEGFDGLVAIGGCDKNMPGCLIGLARLNRPSVFVYGGTILPGENHTDIVSVFEAVGAHARGDLDLIEVKQIEETAIPGPGSCGGMYTANTMASAIEAMGMSLPGSSAQNAVSNNKLDDCRAAGAAVLNLLYKDIKPRDIMTREAFENAITIVIALGGSTNAVLHLLAMARSVQVELSIDDFQTFSDKVPLIADFKPSGRYLMEDLHKKGGIPAVMKYLLKKGLLHGECLTVTGKTLAENVAGVPDLDVETQTIIVPLEKPLKPTGHLQILYGNLAERGSVAKISGEGGERFEGPARVFDGEKELIAGISSGRVKAGDVVVIKNEGPKGAPGMPEMLKPTSAIIGAGLGNKVALITDGRFSGGTHGFVVGHITPESYEGGLIGLVQDDDVIEIDAVNNRIELKVSDEEITRRRSSWVQPPLKAKNGILYKYAKLVKDASHGCVTDE